MTMHPPASPHCLRSVVLVLGLLLLTVSIPAVEPPATGERITRTSGEWLFQVTPPGQDSPGGFTWEYWLPSRNQDAGEVHLPLPRGGISPTDPNRENTEAWLTWSQAYLAYFIQADLDFPGGTLEQLAAELNRRLPLAYEKQMPESLRKFLPPKIAIVAEHYLQPSPRFDGLRCENTALGALPLFSALSLRTTFAEDPTTPMKTGDSTTVSREPIGLIFHLGIQVINNHVTPPFTVEYYNLRNLSSQSWKGKAPGASDIAALFEIGWRMQLPMVWATTRYHPETDTMIVRGTNEEISIADAAFFTLTGKDPISNPFADLQHKLDEIKATLPKSENHGEKSKETPQIDVPKAPEHP